MLKLIVLLSVHCRLSLHLACNYKGVHFDSRIGSVGILSCKYWR